MIVHKIGCYWNPLKQKMKIRPKQMKILLSEFLVEQLQAFFHLGLIGF